MLKCSYCEEEAYVDGYGLCYKCRKFVKIPKMIRKNDKSNSY